MLINSVDKFRPMVLGSFLHKIISKGLAYRLACIASRIGYGNLFGFVKGRNVHDSIITTSECVNLLDKKCFDGDS